MSRILVTGAAGFLGSILVEHLLDAKHDVVALDNYRHGVPSLAHLVANPKLEIAVGDARDPYVIRPLVQQADVVIPLAAIVGMKACDVDHGLTWTTNRLAVQILCGFAGKQQIVLFPNSNSGYGVGGSAECDEKSPLNPLSQYGKSKLIAEQDVLGLRNGVSFRLATAFGASPRFRLDLLVNDLVHRAVTERSAVIFEGHFRRNFVHCRDIARAFLHAIDHFDLFSREKVFNCGDSRANMTKFGLCEAIKEQIPEFTFVAADSGEDPDKRDYIVSNARLEATGWRPKYSLQDGISELIRLYRGFQARKYVNA